MEGTSLLIHCCNGFIRPVGDIWHGEIKNRAKDGSSYWVDTFIVPTLDERGTAVATVAAARPQARIRRDPMRLIITEKNNSAKKIAEILSAGDAKADASYKTPFYTWTDSAGSEGYNLLLSQRRAESVRDFLIKEGVPKAKLDAKGFGESDPIATNDTTEGRAKNRRVVFRFLGAGE